MYLIAIIGGLVVFSIMLESLRNRLMWEEVIAGMDGMKYMGCHNGVLNFEIRSGWRVFEISYPPSDPSRTTVVEREEGTLVSVLNHRTRRRFIKMLGEKIPQKGIFPPTFPEKL